MTTIQNFEELKGQLTELAKVLNAFNSEAVQLKIIDIIFGELQTSEYEDAPHLDTPKPKKKKSSPRKSKSSKAPDGEIKKSKTKSTGPATVLTTLIDENYFTKRQSLKNIIDHAKNQKATVIKPNDISGVLARFVREGKLKREKNADGQYEYFT